MKFITRTILILSLVSFFTDTASEMLYPVLPIYLKSIGFSVVLIGILEGLAEATAGLSKGYFGKLSDVMGKRLVFIQVGYAMSAIAKPLIGFFSNTIPIFIVRTLDRLGKGIRTGARDAMLSDESSQENKGKVFGFHRSMDTLGAVLGPTLALIYLYYNPEDYVSLFYLSFIPGVLAIIATFLLKEKKQTLKSELEKPSFFSFFKYWKKSPISYRRVIIGLLLFNLFNSSDVFLLLKVKSSGASDVYLIFAYIFYNLVYAIFSYPLGFIADKIGLKKILILGLLLFSLVYFGFAFCDTLIFYFILFFIYGIYAASTEGISKALISNIVNKEDTATAIGLYSGIQSICLLLASSFAGLIWSFFGAKYTFLLSAVISLFVLFYLLSIKIKYAKA